MSDFDYEDDGLGSSSDSDDDTYESTGWDSVDLSFSEDDVEPLKDRFLFDQGIYKFFCSNSDGDMTKNKEKAIVLEWTCEEDEVMGGKAIGEATTDWIVIPGARRQEKEPKKWNLMMNLLRRKLEAITGSNWRESGMTIRPQNFSGSECYIALGVETRPYVNGKGQKMLGTNNTVLAYLRPGEEFDFRTVPVAAAEQGSVGDYGV